MPRPGVGIGLVGRRAERAALLGALERAGAGHGTGVLVSGDAGVGKSRLVGELTAAAGDALVLLGRCIETAGAELPYLPFTEVVGQLRAVAPELVEQRPGLRRLTAEGGTTDRELGQLQVFEALLSALSAAGAQRPVILVLEDLHWADRSSRDLLVFLLSRLAEQRLLVVATYRADDVHRRHPLRPVLAELVRLPAVERLDVAPLPPAEAFALVRDLAADLGLGERELRLVAQRSEGNAFFAEELVSAAGGGGLPEALADVLLTRFERLPAAAQHVLRVASVAGRSVADDTLAEVGGLDAEAFTAAVREAMAHQVLVTDPCGELSFRHALLREAVYEDLLPGERARIHLRYADLVEARLGTGDQRLGTTPAAALAHHALAAHDLPRGLRATVQAAREADRLGAPAEVLTHAERALELWSVVPEAARVAGVDELDVTLWAAWSASATGDPDRGLALSRRALELADGLDDPERAAAVRVRTAIRHLDRADGGPAAAQAAREAIALLERRPRGPELAWAHAILARALWRTDEVDGCRVHGEAALRIAREADAALRAGTLPPPRDPGDTAADPQEALTDALADVAAVEADALISLAVNEEFAGHGPRSRDLLSEALPLARGSGNAGVELRIAYNRGFSFLEEGSLREAVVEFEAGARRAAELGVTWSAYGMDTRVALVITRFMAGDWAEAAAGAQVGGARVAPAVAGRLAAAGLLVAVARGDLDAAEARWAALDSRDQEDDQVVLLLGAAGTEAALWRGDRPEAARRAETALADLRALVPHHLASIMLAALGLAALEPGDRARADGLRETAETTAEKGIPRSGSVGVEGQAWLARVRAEHERVTGTADPRAWAAVVEAFGYGEVYRQAEARARRAEALLVRAAAEAERSTAAGLREEAGRELAAALRAAEALGAAPLAVAVRDLAARSGTTGVGTAGIGTAGIGTAGIGTAGIGTAGVGTAEAGTAEGATTGAGATEGGTTGAGNPTGRTTTGRTSGGRRAGGSPAAAPGGASRSEGAGAGPLTPRERSVLVLVAEGRTNRQVGEALYISEKTVSVHLTRVMAKLGASSRTEAVAVAYGRGLIPMSN